MNGRRRLGSAAGPADVRPGRAARRRRTARISSELKRLALNLPARRARAAASRGRHRCTAAARTRSTARTSAAASSCSATRPAATWAASSTTFSSGWRRSRPTLPDRLLHRIRRAVREPAVGHADDRPAVPRLAGRHVPGALHAVPLGEPVAASAGRPADGGHRRGRGAGRHRPIADGGQHGRLHLAGGHRLAQRHPADRPLPAPGAVRRRSVHAAR